MISDLGVTKCKIASPDADNMRLISECERWFDDIIVSTGMIDNKHLNTLLNDQIR